MKLAWGRDCEASFLSTVSDYVSTAFIDKVRAPNIILFLAVILKWDISYPVSKSTLQSPNSKPSSYIQNIRHRYTRNA